LRKSRKPPAGSRFGASLALRSLDIPMLDSLGGGHRISLVLNCFPAMVCSRLKQGLSGSAIRETVRGSRPGRDRLPINLSFPPANVRGRGLASKSGAASARKNGMSPPQRMVVDEMPTVRKTGYVSHYRTDR
jgi:hypothetical protein